LDKVIQNTEDPAWIAVKEYYTIENGFDAGAYQILVDNPPQYNFRSDLQRFLLAYMFYSRYWDVYNPSN